MFLALIGAVIVFAAALGYVLTRLRVLPGTTAVWGSSAGAATAMVLMSDAFGGDMRLVAVMQYLRVACVGLVASLVARAFLPAGAASPASIIWFPPVEPALPPGDSRLGRGRRNHWGQVQASGRRAACAAVRGRPALSQPFAHDHAAAMASGDLLRAGRLVHRPSIYPRDGSLRLETIAGDLAIDFHADRALRRSRLRPARGGGNGRADRLSRDQPRRGRRGGDHRRLVPGRPPLCHGDADWAAARRASGRTTLARAIARWAGSDAAPSGVQSAE